MGKSGLVQLVISRVDFCCYPGARGVFAGICTGGNDFIKSLVKGY